MQFLAVAAIVKIWGDLQSGKDQVGSDLAGRRFP
jgi:hypothetical protein